VSNVGAKAILDSERADLLTTPAGVVEAPTGSAIRRACRIGLWTLLSKLSDESVVRLYESIREQVAADARMGSRHKFVGESAKQRAEKLREEMDRRRLRFAPIDWPR
jgi:hypothetical protein